MSQNRVRRWVAALGLSAASLAAADEPKSKSGSPPQPGATIKWIVEPARTANVVAVEISGLNAETLASLRSARWETSQWQQLLSVYAEQGDVIADLGLPPMVGRYQAGPKSLRFEPAFPFDPGINYRAVLRPAALPGISERGTKMISSSHRIPAPSSAATTVVRQVYPSAAVLPENLLKFYVHFSAPMSRGHIYEHIHLRDEAGRAVELPFLEIDEELWDPAMTRLTLFIDPGRIKREVTPLEEIGPALVAGRQFTLVIDAAWKDAAGSPLRESFRKTFRVSAPDREPPDPKQWKIETPAPSTHDPLRVTFGEPMDRALAERLIRVNNGNGSPVSGHARLEDEERLWLFVPEQPWSPGAFRLSILTTIEDIAGNNIGKPFEVDLVEPVQRRLTNTTVTVAFDVR